RRSRADPTLLNDFEMAAKGNGDPPVLDLRTMEELCQPSLNGRGGTFMKRHLEECYDLIENMTAHHNDWDTSAQRSEPSSSITSSSDSKIVALEAKMAKINKNLMRVLQVNQQVKAVTPNYETCGGPHSYNDCPATVGQTHNVYATGAHQSGNSYQPQDFHFDIRFTDALLLMPKFASTIKSLLANKDKLFELAKIPLNENCSAMLLKKLPKKFGDPGIFLILCDFPRMDVCHALADLGASINLMPLYIWNNLSLPELTPTQMTLELVDGSITRPKGVAKDVFVKVGKFHFPFDFVVFDFEADPRVPLIIGRSFLRTDRALIDVYGEEITLWVNDEAGSDFILEEIEAYLKDDLVSPKIDHADCDPEGDICLIEKLLNNDPFQLPLIDLKQEEVAKVKSSINKPLELELKELSSHLKYAYLEGTDKLPVIIAKGLKDDEKEGLLKEDYKPTVQSQRRVNPKIHE
nr:reverse transcriptase domain-containing protein [Tanacetum cinerariifolium]